MSSFVEDIVADLRRFAAGLLDPGLAPATRGITSGSSHRCSVLLGMIEQLCRLVPRLVVDLDDLAYATRDDAVTTPVPRRAELSRRACDYQASEGTIVPRTWVTFIPTAEPDQRPLSWLIHVVGAAQAQLRATTGRLEKHLNDALRDADESIYGRLTLPALRQLLADIEEAGQGLARATRAIGLASGWSADESEQMPRPYPRAPSWRALRQLAAALLNPEDSLPAHLHDLLGNGAPIADLPILYQRWCGMKVIEQLDAAGWVSRGDPLPALFLGGALGFSDGVCEMTMWCEPRITTKGHACGLRTRSGEGCPDYVFITPGPGGFDAFVLDPTLSETGRTAKGEYVESLLFVQRKLVAGVPSFRKPLRSWAVAPVSRPHCDVHNVDGSKGTVPLCPSGDARALDAWLGDVIAHATAWSPLRSAGSRASSAVPAVSRGGYSPTQV